MSEGDEVEGKPTASGNQHERPNQNEKVDPGMKNLADTANAANANEAAPDSMYYLVF